MSCVRATPRHAPSSKGLSLIEVLVTLLLLALMSGMALPSLARWIDGRRLWGSAGDITAALHLAQASAIARDQPVAVSMLTTPTGVCHMVHTGLVSQCQCDATQGPQCEGASLISAVVHDTPRLRFSATAASIRFDPRAGTATPAGRFTASTLDGRDIHTVVSLTGRVRRCTTSTQLNGLTRCPA
jgi:prepilin-type N-terminal cleavage/methylation domain-containing protein